MKQQNNIFASSRRPSGGDSSVIHAAAAIVMAVVNLQCWMIKAGKWLWLMVAIDKGKLLVVTVQV